MFGITPKGKQEEVMALPAKGHIVVLGTAGSGKTTIALLRAHHLANIPNGGKVLLVTFNGALVEYMRGISSSQSTKLVVENYHKFARGYLNSRGKMPRWNGILSPEEKAYYIEQAIEALKTKYQTESTFKRPKEFFIEEITFIEKFGFANLAEYRETERIGRASSNIKRENRKWIFAVYEKYMELREAVGRKYDWDDLAFYVFNELQDDDGERRYTHIIVDEGQDFSPMMIKSLVEAVADGGSFTFFGDVAQQIYGSRLSWRDSGVDANKIWRFDVNYRNPATITAFTKAITESEYWRQDGDMVEATAQIAEGPKPILVKFSRKQREMAWVVERAIATGKTSSTVIVCRNRADIDTFLPVLKNKGCDATEINKDTPGFAHLKKVYLTTYHAAKGLEFDNVFIPYLTVDKLPDPDTVSSAVSEEDAYADEIKLLYVAATRSKYGLYMTYSGTLSPLFPEDSDSYDFHDEEDVV
ncbi:3'-5' exonuclease [Pseudobacteroides cellulosolvens]|uniref:DNA 3'-5' helicase n=1 Tax=Pseudobacteroides cellulosolvens ATCC 35603 = DSM 2933 TaxID=398512 RepID=A0A0L6JGG7_9FIRM|nr:3'-5' exonuclease [Pseudobacteroides cellulosolvens]KNY24785.1 UvrD-like DNA helicase [Pseudobacteroides cellulosolvens ATCC 35603 = DSM 2933]